MTTAVQLITDNLDIWTSAVQTKSAAGRGNSNKLDLYGIKKLRELILELAVRGLLASQDPNDEPSSELLKKIATEKAKLIKAGKLRKRKNLADVSEDEKVFGLPDSWEYARLNDLGDWGAGATPSRRNPEFYGGEIPWFKSGELVGDYISQSEEYVTELALEKVSLRYNQKGDVLIAMYGATIGKASILSVPATTNQAVCACTPFTGIESTFLLTLLKAWKHRFIGMGAGGAQPNISREKIIATVVALPPTAEQNRIVAKVDELMALCDQLEQQQETSITAHQTLVQTLLDALTTASEREDFTAAWARIADHFDTLFTTEWTIDQLKQTILQLAVMGRLVAQDPNDEPARGLLAKIAAEKVKLVKAGKLKKQKVPPTIDEDKASFKLPEGWAYERFGNVVFNRDAERVPLSVDERESRRGRYDYYGASGVIDSIDDYLFDKPLLLIGEDGANLVNRSSPIAFMARGKYWVNNHAHVLDGLTEELLLYVCLHINAISLMPYVTGTAQPKMNQAKMNSILLAIPPAEEQRRIVAKVAELMALCDTLKTRVNMAQTIQLRLADALAES